MEFGRIADLVNGGGDPALGFFGGAFADLTFCQQDDFSPPAGFQGSGQSRDASADNKKIALVFMGLYYITDSVIIST